MRETYFTTETLKRKAGEMLASAQSTIRRGLERFEVENSALLVLDMQDYFFIPESHAYVPSGEAIVSGICDLIDAYRKRGLPVIFTRHVNTTEDAGMMGVWWRDLINPERPESDIIPELNTNAGVVVQKSQYDAFYGSGLAASLRERGVRQVVIGGVLTHLCCETSARSAFVQGYEVFFLVDGTATYEEAFHMASLRNLAHGFASLALCEEIVQKVSGDSES